MKIIDRWREGRTEAEHQARLRVIFAEKKKHFGTTMYWSDCRHHFQMIGHGGGIMVPRDQFLWKCIHCQGVMWS